MHLSKITMVDSEERIVKAQAKIKEEILVFQAVEEEALPQETETIKHGTKVVEGVEVSVIVEEEEMASEEVATSEIGVEEVMAVLGASVTGAEEVMVLEVLEIEEEEELEEAALEAALIEEEVLKIEEAEVEGEEGLDHSGREILKMETTEVDMEEETLNKTAIGAKITTGLISMNLKDQNQKMYCLLPKNKQKSNLSLQNSQ